MPPSTEPRTFASARAAARARHGQALRRFWRDYRHHRLGMTGLALILVFSVIALLVPLFSDPRGLQEAFATGPPLAKPNGTFLLGTDAFGRSVLTLTLWGTRISLVVGLAASGITILIGTTVGVVSGYFGGRTDTVLNGLTNWFLVLPWIPLAIALAAILGPTLINVIVVIGITSWASPARLVRAQTLSLRERPFVERARALGATNWHIMRRHVLPNLVPIVSANTVLAVAIAILSETTLSLLGLGDPNSISWGTVIEEAFNSGAITIGAWWWLLPPGIAIVLVVLAFTMCGYAMEEILNPRLHRTA